jgi:hypothetical protein
MNGRGKQKTGFLTEPQKERRITVIDRYAKGWKELFRRPIQKPGVIVNAMGTEFPTSKMARTANIYTEEQGCRTLRNDVLVKALLLRPTEAIQ